jgi:hypothetical protein
MVTLHLATFVTADLGAIDIMILSNGLPTEINNFWLTNRNKII